MLTKILTSATVALALIIQSAQAGVIRQRAICYPISANNTAVDDVPALQSAIKQCGNAGTIVVRSGTTFNLLTTLDFTGCQNCDFRIEGTLKFGSNLTYWNGKKAMMMVNNISGARIRSALKGGIIDGSGQAAYDYFATNSAYRRPNMLYINNSTDISVSGLTLQNPPNVFIATFGYSARIAYSNLILSAISTSSAQPLNTDGFDIGFSSFVSLDSIQIRNRDDCVALKPGANYVTVNGLDCYGSHGVSVGSLGGKAGTVDTVTNVYATNIQMFNSTKGVGIKLYDGSPNHGSALVQNVTVDTVSVQGVGFAASIETCYNSDNATSCAANPSKSILRNVKLNNISGYVSPPTSGKPVVANLNCPASGVCDVKFNNFNVGVGPAGSKGIVLCGALNSTLSGVTCTAGAYN